MGLPNNLLPSCLAACRGDYFLNIERSYMSENQAPAPEKKIIVVASTKSVGIAVLLTFIFGPLGLFYSSIWGGIFMLLLALLSIPFSVITLGIPYFFIWIACIIWGALAANSYNKKLLNVSGPHVS
jgi:hypothetical protein